MWSRLRESNYFLFEVFIFARMAGLYSSQIAQNLLLQDKICLFNYNQSVASCENIQATQAFSDENMKDHILADTAQFANYIYILQCIPMFIWSMFIGSFLDNYPKGTMLMLFNCVAGDIVMVMIYVVNVHFYEISPMYLLITSSTYWITGGFTSYLTAIYKYIITHSNDKSRSFRFMLFELSLVLGLSFGTYFAGQILTIKQSDAAHPQIRTYYWNFIANLGFDVISLILLFVVHKMDKSRIRNNIKLSQTINGESENLINHDLNNNHERIAQYQSNDESTNQNILKVLFNLDNIKQIFLCIVKPRENNTRLHIYTLFLILFFQVFIIFGIDGVLFQFAEKVYHWNSAQYTTYSSISRIISILLMAVLTSILIKHFKWADGPLMVLSHMSSFFCYNVTGTFLNPLSYFIGVPIGSLNGFAIITTRSKLSKIVAQDEVGKIFSLIATMEAGVPIFASPSYSNLFAATISNLPGMIYQFSAAIIALSLIVTVCEEIFFVTIYH